MTYTSGVKVWTSFRGRGLRSAESSQRIVGRESDAERGCASANSRYSAGYEIAGFLPLQSLGLHKGGSAVYSDRVALF